MRVLQITKENDEREAGTQFFNAFINIIQMNLEFIDSRGIALLSLSTMSINFYKMIKEVISRSLLQFVCNLTEKKD